MPEAAIPPCGSFPPFGPDGTPTPFPEGWRTETVLALAHGIVADNALDRLPILADALEEAGCDDLLLLHHCRYCPHHLPECWAVQTILPSDQLHWTDEMRAKLADAVARASGHGEWDEWAREEAAAVDADRRRARAMWRVVIYGILLLALAACVKSLLH